MKKIITFLLIACAVMVSCTKSGEEAQTQIDPNKVQLTPDEVTSLSFYNDQELSDAEVIWLVAEFNNAQNKGRKTRSETSDYKINRKTYINPEGEFSQKAVATRAGNGSDELTSPIVEVQFHNNNEKGLAFVSADARKPGIIAFIPKMGSEYTMKQSGAEELLKISKASYLYELTKVKEIADANRETMLAKINSKLGIPMQEINYDKVKDKIELVDPVTRATPVQRLPPGVNYDPDLTIDPKIKVNWGQEEPFNSMFYTKGDKLYGLVRKASGDGYGYFPVGCVNVAIGQILTFTKPLMSIPMGNISGYVNWEPMISNPTTSNPIHQGGAFNDLAYLLLYLYTINDTDSSATDWQGYHYVSNVSEENMIKTMNRYFRFDPKRIFLNDPAWKALRDNRVILGLTSDHAFIIDGLLVANTVTQTRQLVKEHDTYWHANFGWSDEYTGFYKVESDAHTHFEAGGQDFWETTLEYMNNIRGK